MSCTQHTPQCGCGHMNVNCVCLTLWLDSELPRNNAQMLVDAPPCTRHERVTVSTRLLPFSRVLLFFWVMVPPTGCVVRGLLYICPSRGVCRKWLHSSLAGSFLSSGTTQRRVHRGCPSSISVAVTKYPT